MILLRKNKRMPTTGSRDNRSSGFIVLYKNEFEIIVIVIVITNNTLLLLVLHILSLSGFSDSFKNLLK